jgi:hypothetical protein
VVFSKPDPTVQVHVSGQIQHGVTVGLTDEQHRELEDARVDARESDGSLPSKSELLRRSLRLYVELENPDEMI